MLKINKENYEVENVINSLKISYYELEIVDLMNNENIMVYVSNNNIGFLILKYYEIISVIKIKKLFADF